MDCFVFSIDNVDLFAKFLTSFFLFKKYIFSMMNDCEDNGEKTNDPDLSDMNIFKPGHIDMNTGIHILDRK